MGCNCGRKRALADFSLQTTSKKRPKYVVTSGTGQTQEFPTRLEAEMALQEMNDGKATITKRL